MNAPAASAPGTSLALLRLLHLASPALPVGAYAYSQGLEWAVQAGWVRDAPGTQAWLQGLAQRGLGSLDLPVLARLHQGWQQGAQDDVTLWNARLIASRPTQELRAEDEHLGSALARVLAGLGAIDTQSGVPPRPAFATLFALAAVRWQIGVREALTGYLWSWTENQVLAAIKLVPLGQSAGQSLLHRLAEDMPAIVERALALPDDEIAASTLSQTLASALHETQYSRLFRS